MLERIKKLFQKPEEFFSDKEFNYPEETEVEILGRKIEIKTQLYPYRTPPQTTYSVSGELKGTHIPGGLGGVTIETDPEKVLEDLRETVEERMTTPVKPNVMTSS